MKLEELFKICHEGVAGGHRGVAGTLDKFQRTFFTMSAREKIRRLVERCDTCLTVGNVGEKVFIDLVSMSETVRKKSLSVNSTGWVYKICRCISNLQ